MTDAARTEPTTTRTEPKVPRKRAAAKATAAPEPQAPEPQAPEPTNLAELAATADLYGWPQRYAAEHGQLPNVHQAIAEAMRVVRAVGKWGRNREQNYAFRSIDDFMTALSPALAHAGVHVVPKVLERQRSTGQTRSGNLLHLVDLRVRFRIYGPAGDYVTVVAWGEGTDSADKATNKAMTGAFKYAILQAFMVPTQDMDDADRTTPEAQVSQPDQPDQPQLSQAERDTRVAQLYGEVLAASQLPRGERTKALGDLWRSARAVGGLEVQVQVPVPWRPAAGGAETMALGQLLQGAARDLPDPRQSAPDDDPELAEADRVRAEAQAERAKAEQDPWAGEGEQPTLPADPDLTGPPERADSEAVHEAARKRAAAERRGARA